MWKTRITDALLALDLATGEIRRSIKSAGSAGEIDLICLVASVVCRSEGDCR